MKNRVVLPRTQRIICYELTQGCLSHGESFDFITYTLCVNQKCCGFIYLVSNYMDKNSAFDGDTSVSQVAQW